MSRSELLLAALKGLDTGLALIEPVVAVLALPSLTLAWLCWVVDGRDLNLVGVASAETAWALRIGSEARFVGFAEANPTGVAAA